MLAEYKPNVKWGLWVGILLQAICGPLLAWRLANSPDQNAAIADPSNLAIAVILLGGIYCWALGCGDLARGKGHAVSLGCLLSLLSLAGLFILWVLPDHHPFDAFGSRKFTPIVTPLTAATAAPPIPVVDPKEEGGWYYANAGGALGPVSEPVVLEMAHSGYLRRSDLVWKPGLPNWLSAESQFGDAFKPAAPPSPEPPVLAAPPPRPQAAAADDTDLSAALTRSAPKMSLFSWSLALPVAALIALSVAVLILWPKYSSLFSPGSAPAAQKSEPPQHPAAPEPAPTPPPAPPPQSEAPAKPAPISEAPALQAPAPRQLPTSGLTGAYRRIDPAPVSNRKTHAFARAELLLQQLNPRLLQFDVRLKSAGKVHAHPTERELKGVAKGQGDSFAYDYVDASAPRSVSGGHCLEIHFQQGNAWLSVPQDAPGACLETAAVAGVYSRSAAAGPRS